MFLLSLLVEPDVGTASAACDRRLRVTSAGSVTSSGVGRLPCHGVTRCTKEGFALLRLSLLALVILMLCTLVVSGVCADPPCLDHLWVNQAKWTLDATGLGASFGFHYPSMMWQGNEIWAYYIKHQLWGGVTRFAVGRARSTDGLNWTDDGYCMPAGGIWRWVYQAQASNVYHQIGRVDGDGWSANCAQDNSGYLCYGPYTTDMRVGPNDAGFHLMIDNNTAGSDVVATLDVFDATTGTVLATRQIHRNEFTATWTYQVFDVNFYIPAWSHQIEFRTYWNDHAYIKQLSVAVAEGYYPHWDSFNSSFPGVWKDTDNMYYMVYEGSDGTSGHPGDIGLAMSGDGLNFFRHATNPILLHNTTGWESTNIGTPSLYKESGIWYLYYHGFDAIDCRIGMATGSNILGLSKYAYNPTIPTVSNTWESGTTGKRSSLLRGPITGLYYMAYEGSTEQPYDTARWATGIARSQDKFYWDKYTANPIVPQTGGGFGNDGPELIVINGTTYLYVRSQYGGEDRYRLDWK